jgi:hypothetical protein
MVLFVAGQKCDRGGVPYFFYRLKSQKLSVFFLLLQIAKTEFTGIKEVLRILRSKFNLFKTEKTEMILSAAFLKIKPN